MNSTKGSTNLKGGKSKILMLRQLKQSSSGSNSGSNSVSENLLNVINVEMRSFVFDMQVQSGSDAKMYASCDGKT